MCAISWHIQVCSSLELKTWPRFCPLSSTLSMVDVLKGAPAAAEAAEREPKSCLGPVFYFKLGCFVTCAVLWHIQVRLSLELKTRPRFCPLSSSLYKVDV
jgi:hypothetical protein